MCIVMDNWTRSEAKERRGRRLLKISRTLHTLTKMNGNQTTWKKGGAKDQMKRRKKAQIVKLV